MRWISSTLALALGGCLVNDDLYSIRLAALSDDDGDGVSEEQGDCDDNDAARYPGADELCDGEDDNCDGLADNDAIDRIWYVDSDGDGYGNEAGAQASCAPPGSAWQLQAGDCDDGEPTIHPGTSERCDGVDEDCDGSIDEDAVDPRRWYLDGDGDGYGGAGQSVEACEAPSTAYVTNASDCDDASALTYPNASEICDGADNDCDGRADDPPVAGTGAWYPDSDGDGYGDGRSEISRCEGGDAFVDNGDDCDDEDGAVSPDATEVCNDGQDNNCDGSAGACVWDAVVDLTDHGILSGQIEAEFYGTEFASLDTNGDGVQELLVSSLFGSPTRDYDDAPGMVEMYLTLPTTVTSRTTAAWTLWGQAHIDGLKLSRESGDISQDGFDDIFVSSRGHDHVGTSSGAAYILFGPSTPSGRVGAVADWTILGTHTDYSFGDFANFFADVSGDGKVDLAIGSSDADVVTAGEGAIYLISGLGAGTDDVDDIATASFVGSVERGDLGSDLDAIDLDADGLSDLVIGMTGWNDGATYGGSAFVFLGPVRGDHTEDDADHQISPESGSTVLGTAIANAGDQDGDGLDDLLITDPQCGAAGYTGAAYLLYANAAFTSLSISDANLKLRGDAGMLFASTGDNIGDLNQDGFTDLAMGSYFSSSAAGYIFYGPLDRPGVYYSSSADVLLQGDTDDDRIGRIVNLGDMTGDGAPDLAVGSHYWGTSTALGAGRAFFLPGTTW